MGLRFTLAFFSGMAVEASFLTMALGLSCGPMYLINSAGMLAVYIGYTMKKEMSRIKIIRAQKEAEKKQEVF